MLGRQRPEALASPRAGATASSTSQHLEDDDDRCWRPVTVFEPDGLHLVDDLDPMSPYPQQVEVGHPERGPDLQALHQVIEAIATRKAAGPAHLEHLGEVSLVASVWADGPPDGERLGLLQAINDTGSRWKVHANQLHQPTAWLHRPVTPRVGERTGSTHPTRRRRSR